MFNIIAVSETWLIGEKEADVVIDGYNLLTTNRKSKNGGGVDLFISD